MECPQCSGIETEEHATDDGFVFDRCPECTSVWMDSAELSRLLLRNRLPGLDALGGRVNLSETAGTCPEDLTDLVVVEAIKKPDLTYAMCEICGGVWITPDGETFPEDAAGALASIVGFFKTFAAAR
ncbi:MAG: hypothetical protein D6729_15085 [Deltaproteobacteria bacterium]|nr:MAG: hypothetical protein D6729_15085 [Deltaproteobacteria bacterium]